MTYYSKAGLPIEPLDGELTLKSLTAKAYEVARNRASYADSAWVPRQCVDVFLAPELYRSMVSELREILLSWKVRACVIGDYVRVNLDGVSMALVEDYRLPSDVCVMPFFPDIENGVVTTPSCHWCGTGCRPVYVGDYAI